MNNETALAILNGQTTNQNFSSVQSVGEQCVTCPDNRNVTEPCDITKLSLLVLDGKKTYQVDISNTRMIRGNNAVNIPQGKEKYQLARLYDGILEVIASIPDPKKPNSGLFITATMEDLTNQCPLATHPRVKLNNIKPEIYDELQQPVSAVAQSIKPLEVFAKRLPIDLDVGDFNLLDVFYMFKDTQNAEDVKQIEVTASSCGVRDDGSIPNRKIKGLIRVYREDKYELSIVLPKKALKKSSYSVEKDAKGEITKIESKQDGKYLNSTVMDSDGKITKLTEQQHSLFTTTDTELTADMELTEESQLRKFVTFTRNGKPLGVISSLNNIIKIRNMIIEGASFIDEFTQSLPKVGFSWSMGVDVFAGKLTGEWGIQSGSRHDSEFYNWVSPYGHIRLDMTVIAFEIGASFGIQCQSPSILDWFERKAFELIAMIEFKATVDLKVNKTFELVNDNKDESDDEPPWQAKIEAAVVCKTLFKVNVYGIGVDAGGGVHLGYEIDSKVTRPFGLTVQVIRKSIYVNAYFIASKRKESKRWTQKLCDEKVLVEETPIF